MKLKVITSNPGKVAEYSRSFADLGIEMEHFRLPYDEVQTSDLAEVVSKGMDEIEKKGVRDYIIDDSGLFVDALKGFPGVWSAYAQKTIGNQGILRLMDGVEDRGAEFRCCIGCDIAGQRIIVTGICRGVIIDSERGEGGFGFDPIFSPDGDRTFAEIPIEEKNSMSHRGNAVSMLIEEMKKRGLVRRHQA
jgi:XTP/dITP diphosphohydrolase